MSAEEGSGVLGGGDPLTFCLIQSRNTTVWKCFRGEHIKIGSRVAVV